VLSELNFYLKWGGQGEEKKTGSRQEEVSMVDTDKSKHHIKDVDHLRIAEAPPLVPLLLVTFTESCSPL
jgi:hypothetical protein